MWGIEPEFEWKATPADAMRQYADVVGNDHPDREWILTDYDVWVQNPHYKGLPQPHPEEDY